MFEFGINSESSTSRNTWNLPDNCQIFFPLLFERRAKINKLLAGWKPHAHSYTDCKTEQIPFISAINQALHLK